MVVDVYGGVNAMPDAASGGRQALSSEEKRRGNAWLAGLEQFLAVRETMPAQYLKAFMLVALDEGRGVQEYANKSGVAQSVMSRHLLDLGEKDRYHNPGFGLVTQRLAARDSRKHEYWLTPKGQALFRRVVRPLEVLEG